MKIGIAQLNPVVGDFQGNLKKLEEALAKAECDLLVFPELFLTGYPPRDLLERPGFIQRAEVAIDEVGRLSQRYPEMGLIIGAPLREGERLYNAALLISKGEIIAIQAKSLLPNYDVFDEMRYFTPAEEVKPVEFKGKRLGITICEDAWNDPQLGVSRRYHYDPVANLAQKGVDLFINIAASPFSIGKEEIRFRIIRYHARKHSRPFIFINQVGANDELIFDGRSMCLDGEGRPIAVLPPFKEAIEVIDIRTEKRCHYQPQDRIESVYEALVLGIQDYMGKCGFTRAVLGLSGGIDSSVTACLACEAIGAKNVLGVAMPSPYSSPESVDLAQKLASNLGIQLEVISITDVYECYRKSLSPSLQLGNGVDITLENIQARIRGNILMAISNRFGHLVLSTGNKSELAVGYCTLYGDMTGGLAVISDVPKTMVYQLAEYINRKREIIPQEIIDRAPSAELKPDQKDQDTLPPYEILDQILYHYIDEHKTQQEIVKMGFDPEVVQWVVRAVNRNEYKRRQAAPGLKVTTRAFGVGWRMPIAARYNV
ncbi:NAD+ synthase [candidate division WOR-3 bacterium]|uniref:Glutamine-dependent NAD(+) synthetase n=1 Tax=candidate division WOR-3 bacterium TaxID=2052148 RepID=A0A660SC15_UNCW3|nr:MAG: NAD+ synthase [candidate division WOR-3 bacterium]